jgi:hypothetical protein
MFSLQTSDIQRIIRDYLKERLEIRVTTKHEDREPNIILNIEVSLMLNGEVINWASSSHPFKMGTTPGKVRHSTFPPAPDEE